MLRMDPNARDMMIEAISILINDSNGEYRNTNVDNKERHSRRVGWV